MTGLKRFALFIKIAVTAAVGIGGAAAAPGQVNPAQIRWPQCVAPATVYNIVTGTCDATGTANNPAGSTQAVQFNNGGVFGGTSALTTDGTGDFFAAGTLHGIDPMLPDPALATLQGCLRNAPNQICPIVIVPGDSTWCCIGPANIANGPSFQYQQYARLQGYPMRGTGLYTVNANPGAPKAGWKALNPTLSGIGQTSELGPSQTGEAAFGSVWTAATIGSVVQGFALVDLPVLDAAGVGLAGNQLIIEGMTDSTTTAGTVIIDPIINFATGAYSGGTVLTTSLGGTTSTPTAYYQTYNIPGSSSSTTHTVLIIPTNLTAGKVDIYACGYNQNSAGVEIDDFATGNARSEAYGTATATQMAFVGAMPVPPVAAFVVISINDMINGTGVTQAQYSANVQNSINYLLSLNPQMSIIIVDEQNVSPSAPVLTKTQVQSTEYALAQTYVGQYLSIAETWGTEANAAARGWMLNDGIHFTDVGGRNLSGMVWADITSGLPPLPINAAAATNQYVLVPSNYSPGAATTAVGATVTYISATPIFFDTSATIDVFNCTNPTFNATAPTIVSITGNVVVMTYASAPTGGSSTIDCAINSNEVILNGTYGTTFNVGAPTYQNYTNVIFSNIVTGLTYTVTLNGGGTYSNVWPAAFIPNAPPVPGSGQAETFGAVLTSPITAAFTYPWRLTPTASFSGAIAAGACLTNTASVQGTGTTGMEGLGYRIGTTNTYEVSFYPYPGDVFRGKINYLNSLTANVQLCNTAATSQTPTTTVGYSTVQ